MHTLQARHLSTLKEKIIGLVGKHSAEPVYFTTRWGIHTFGLHFAIDVLILNTRDEVVQYKENIKPNNIFLWNPRYFRVVELAGGTIKKLQIKKKEKVHLL